MLNNPVHGRTALNDALKLGLQHLEKGRRDKKTLVLISDGGDNASHMTFETILARAQSRNVVIYTVGLPDPIGDEGER